MKPTTSATPVARGTFHAAASRHDNRAVHGGMELALTILLFVLIGLAVDAWLGTTPWAVIGLFLFAAIGSGLRLYYTSAAEFERLERERADASASRRSPGGAVER